MLTDNWWDIPAPERLFDQFFGEPVTGPRHPATMLYHPLALAPYPYYMRPVRRATSRETDELGTGFTDVHNDAKLFTVRLDVSHFQPDEIKVTTTGNTLIVKGQHEEKPDEHGHIERTFVRKYTLPKECNVEQVTSQLSRDGVLTVSAPKLAIEGTQERHIPITVIPIDEKKKVNSGQLANGE